MTGPRYAISLAIQLDQLKDATMSLSDDITTQTASIERNTAILTDVKTTVDTIRGAVDPTIVARFDAAVAGEGAAVQALAADVNVDQTPAPAPTPVVEPTPAPVEPVTTPTDVTQPGVDANGNPLPVDPNAPPVA